MDKLKHYTFPGFAAADLVCKGLFRARDVKPGSMQAEVLEAIRFTDTFRDMYGEAVLNRPGSNITEAAIKSLKRLRKIEFDDIEPYRAVLGDMIYSKYVLGFKFWEYFTYDMEHKTIAERLEYMPENSRLYFYNEILLRSKSERIELSRKFLTYQRLKKQYNRAICMIKDENDKEAFLAFAAEVGDHRFMIKPSSGSLGKGIRYVVCDEEHPAEALFHELLKEGSLVCEEEIISHEFFSRFHESSLNCVRIHTVYNGKEVRHIFPWVKFGANGNHIASAAEGGGMDAPVDVATGMIFGDAGDESANRYSAHPNSGIPFDGQQIPDWQGCLDMTAECAKKFPGVPIIGWDIALSKDRGWQIVEGNPQAMFTTFQFAANHPVLREFVDMVNWVVETRDQD